MSRRRGFTIIELLAVVTIIGLLASIALPRYQLLKQRALVAAMISDLRSLLGAQEGFLATYGDYAGGIVSGPDQPGSGGAGRVSMALSDGVQVTLTYQNSAGTGQGWSAVATHPSVNLPTTDECGVFVGHLSYSPNIAVPSPGEIRCY